jgi:hypothetical protein
MRWKLFKVFMFLGGFLYTQLWLMPRVLSVSGFPLWINVILMTLMLTLWMALIDLIIRYINKKFGSNDAVL